MIVRATPVTVVSFGRSEIGLVRPNNEDCWASISEKNFYILADGMGGHRAGEIAARETVDKLSEQIRKNLNLSKGTVKEHRQQIRELIQEVNHAVFLKSKTDEELKGMGTTLCCTYFHEKGVVFAHVGDSRIYRFNRNSLKQLTRDHSLVYEMIELGELSERSAGEVTYKNIITRAIGTSAKVDVSIGISEFEDDDLFMMCSDGLSDLLPTEDMEKIIQNTSSVKETVDRLIEAAIERGGIDNVTVLVMCVETK